MVQCHRDFPHGGENTVKKHLSLFLAALMAALILASCLPASAGTVYEIRLDVHFIESSVFPYDVDLFLNDLQVAELPHGRDYTGNFFAAEGANTLRFFTHGNEAAAASLDLDVTGDATVRCTLVCTKERLMLLGISNSQGKPELSAGTEDTAADSGTAPDSAPDAGPANREAAAVRQPEDVPEPEQPGETKVNVRSDKISFHDVDLTAMSDAELARAGEAIQAERRSRLKTTLSLSKTSIVLNTGKTEKLTASVKEYPEGDPAPVYEWRSSDKNVVTCDKGTVKAVRSGSAVVTCSVRMTGGMVLTAECSVQVNIPVNSLTTSKRSVTLGGGETYKPPFYIKPDNATVKDLVFSSSRPDVASVSEQGVIEGTGSGSAVITARAADGSGKTLTINVKVVDKRITEETAKLAVLTGIVNDRSADIVKQDGKTYDKTKFHNYSDFDTFLTVVDEGTWTTLDGGNNWHVGNLLVQDKATQEYCRYRFDVRFDGKNYRLENGMVAVSSTREALDQADSTKYEEKAIASPTVYTYLVISPKQLK